MRIAYLFTTFPKLSERFFLREVEALRAQGLDFDVYSMVGGEAIAGVGPVRHFRGRDWLCFLWEWIGWCFRKPAVTCSLLAHLNPLRYRSLVNYGENALGLAFAFRFARSFEGRYSMTHGTWATAPGMGAYAIKALLGVDYTLEAHAYDIYRHGGDAFLPEKLKEARAIRCSTESAATEIRRRLGRIDVETGGEGSKVFCVRRGLAKIPEYAPPSPPGKAPWQLLSVGRLIEKKGYLEQLALFAELKARGLRFEARIVGSGRLESKIRARIQQLDLEAVVFLTGKLEHAAVDAAYRSADLFLFYGRISASGDRDGFPNVLAEAMSFGLPVFSTDVAGTTEVIRAGETGYLLDGGSPAKDAEAIVAALSQPAALATVAERAHQWVGAHFSVEANAEQLKRRLWAADSSKERT